MGGPNFQIIEDVIGVNSGMPVQQPNVTHQSAHHPGYGMQLPQPLKQTQVLSTSYVAPSNTMQTFNRYQVDEVASGGGSMQSSAIRGRIASPHVYQWDAAPIQNKPIDYRTMSGMMPGTNAGYQSNTMDPKQSLREAVSSVYSNANMLKVAQQGIWSIYKCPVENMTSGSYKYIVAIVPNHEFVQLGQYYSLRSLPWISFQTRSTENPAAEFGQTRPTPVNYYIPRDNKHPIFDVIKQVGDTSQSFVYVADSLPCKVELLKVKNTDTAAAKSNLMSALEAFKTVITMTDA